MRNPMKSLVLLGLLLYGATSAIADDRPEPGSLKELFDSDAVRDAAGVGQLFESGARARLHRLPRGAERVGVR